MEDAATVEGRVVDAKTGAPVPEYSIKYCYEPSFMLLDQRYAQVNNSDGVFQFSVAQEGEVRIAVRADGYLLGYVSVKIDKTMPEIRNVEIPLQPQPDLTGVVHKVRDQPSPVHWFFRVHPAIDGTRVRPRARQGMTEPSCFQPRSLPITSLPSCTQTTRGRLFPWSPSTTRASESTWFCLTVAL